MKRLTKNAGEVVAYVGAHNAFPDTGMIAVELTLAENYPENSKAVREILTKLAAYEDTNLSPEEVKELAEAKAEGRLVVLQPHAKEGDLKPSCFYADVTDASWCLGLTHGDDDYPIKNCQKCWYSEHNVSEREEAEAALAKEQSNEM